SRRSAGPTSSTAPANPSVPARWPTWLCGRATGSEPSDFSASISPIRTPTTPRRAPHISKCWGSDIVGRRESDEPPSRKTGLSLLYLIRTPARALPVSVLVQHLVRPQTDRRPARPILCRHLQAPPRAARPRADRGTDGRPARRFA